MRDHGNVDVSDLEMDEISLRLRDERKGLRGLLAHEEMELENKLGIMYEASSFMSLVLSIFAPFVNIAWLIGALDEILNVNWIIGFNVVIVLCFLFSYILYPYADRQYMQEKG